MTDLLKLIASVAEQIQTWPVSSALVGCLIAFGYALKCIGLFPNRFIPMTVIVAAVVLNVYVGDQGKISPTQRNPGVVLGLYGGLLGFAAWMLHATVIRHIEDLIASLFAAFMARKRAAPEPEIETDPTQEKS